MKIRRGNGKEYWGWIPTAMLITAIVAGAIALLVWLVAFAWSVWGIWRSLG